MSGAGTAPKASMAEPLTISGNRSCVAERSLRESPEPSPRWEGRALANQKTRAYGLRAHYGMTLADFEAMSVAQQGRCAICRQEPPPGVVLTVDHNHDTGVIRGLLCRGCNMKLHYVEVDKRMNRRQRDWRALAFAYLLGDRPHVHVKPISPDRLRSRNRMSGGKP